MNAATVAVVIPVYNAERYLAATLDSVWSQTLAQERITVIAVDDGSTDTSLQMLRDQAEKHPNLVVLSEPGSGSPSRPRNLGIERAATDFIFFLDADDLLTPPALERMLEVAAEHEADVVLAKMAALNGRTGVPQSMFGVDHMDADIVDQRLYLALGPTKLFRRSHLLEHGLRFPTDLRVGEDKPFVAEALLTSRRTCVVADQPYYLVRERDDPSEHLGRASESAREALVKAERLAAVLERHTEPGERRDVLMQRVFGGSFQGIFRWKLVRMSPSKRADLLAEVAASLGHLWTDGAREHVSAYGRVLLDLAFAGRADELVELERWRDEHRGDVLRAVDGEWRLDLPDTVIAVVGTGTAAKSPPLEYSMTGMQVVDGDLVLQGWVAFAGAVEAPDDVVLLLQRRESDATVEIRARLGGATAGPKVRTRWFRAQVAIGELPSESVWDAFLVVGSGGTRSRPARFGSRRGPGLPTTGLLVADRAIAYFTHTYSNLSIDVGFTTKARPSPVSTVAVDWDELGRPIMYVRSPGLQPAHVRVDVDLQPPGDGPVAIETVGPDLLAVTLPHPTSDTKVRATAVVEGSRYALTLPKKTALAPPGSSTIAGDVVTQPAPPTGTGRIAGALARGRRAARRLAAGVVRRLPPPVADRARGVYARLRSR